MREASEALQIQRATDFAAWDQHAPAVNEFTDLTKAALSGKPQKIKSGGKIVVLGGEAFYAYLLSLTHHCWWTMVNEQLLPPSWQARSREMSGYLGHDILLLTSPA